VHPILTRFGPFFVYSFTAVFTVGILLGWAITQHQAGTISVAGWRNAALTTLLTGWLGARISFVWLNWSYFAARPSELFHLWQGGLTAVGGLAGGMIGLWVWCWWRERPFLAYAALFSPAFLLLIVSGWAACWMEGCAYGTETWLGPFSASLPDNYGIFAVRFQTQLLGIGLNLLALIFVLLWQKRWGNGRLFPISLILASLIHFGLTFLRGDAVITFAGWRLDSWLALLFAILGGFLLQYGRYQNSRRVGE